MDAERKAGLRRIVNSAIADNYEDELFTVDQCRDLLDALDAAEARVAEHFECMNAALDKLAAAEARVERVEAEWDRVGVCDTCDNLSEDLLDSDGQEQCSACTKLATVTAERDRLREQQDDAEARAERAEEEVFARKHAINSAHWSEWLRERGLDPQPMPDTWSQNIIAERDRLREALLEVVSWIDNWGPSFTEDGEWPATAQKVRALLNRPECREVGDE